MGRGSGTPCKPEINCKNRTYDIYLFSLCYIKKNNVIAVEVAQLFKALSPALFTLLFNIFLFTT